MHETLEPFLEPWNLGTLRTELNQTNERNQSRSDPIRLRWILTIDNKWSANNNNKHYPSTHGHWIYVSAL